jgi:hypothetical protein
VTILDAPVAIGAANRLSRIVEGIGLFAGLGAIAFTAAFAADPSPLVTGGPKAYLTLCAEKLGVESPATRLNWVERPKKDGTDSPFEDQPFAVNVPFEVRYDGGIARVTYSITVTWGHPPEKWDEETKGLGGVDAGLFRPDGKSLADGSVFSDVFTYQRTPDKWTKLIWDQDAPVPSWATPWQNKGDRYGMQSIVPETGAHVPFGPHSRNSFVLAPCVSGWYTLWTAYDLTQSWPSREPTLEALHGTLRVDVVVSRGKNGVRDQDFAYLFGRGKRPPDLTDDTLFLVTTAEIPFTLRRDGWAFDHAEVKLVNPDFEKPKVWGNDVKLDTKIAGSESDLNLQMTSWSDSTFATKPPHPAEVIGVDKYAWKVEYPQTVPDLGFANLTIDGGIQRAFNTANWHFQVDPKAYTDANTQTYLNWDVNLRGGDPTAQTHWTMEWFTRPAQGYNMPEVHKEFLDEFGQAADAWWSNDVEANAHRGPQPGDPPFRFVLRGQTNLVSAADRQLITGGTYPLVATFMGPWSVTAYYHRLSCTPAPDSAPGAPAGPVSVIQDHDEYWNWYADLSALIDAKKQEVDFAKATGVMLGIEVQNLRRSQQILLDSQMSVPDGDWVDFLESEILTPALTATGVMPAPSATISDTAAYRKTQLLFQNGQALSEGLKGIDQATAEGSAALAAIVAELNRGCGLYSVRHPEVLIFRQNYRELADRFPLEMAVAAGDPATFQKAVASLSDKDVSAQIRIWEAQLCLQRRDSLGALYAARDALLMEPDNADAKRLCCEMEAAFIGSSLRKAHGAIEDARAAFYKYLKERGYDKNDPKNGWLSQCWAPLRYIDGEAAMAVFSSGASTIAVRFGADRAAEEERGLTAYEASMTRAYLGLQAILRLSMRGHTLAEIAEMKSDDLRAALPLRHAGSGAQYMDTEVAGFGALIHEAAKNLPDLQVLIADNRVEIQSAVAKGYWDPKDVGNTWAEWIGDLSSPKNLITLLTPMAVAKIGGQLQTVGYWGVTGLSETATAANAAAGVTSGTEMIATVVGWDRAMKALGGTKAGANLLNLLERMHQYESGLGLLPKNATIAQQLVANAKELSWYSSKFVATMVVQSLAGAAAEKIGGDKAHLLVDCFMMLAQDHDLSRKLLKSGAVDPKTMGRLIHEIYLPNYQAAQQKIEDAAARNPRLIKLIADRQAGNTLVTADAQFFEAALQKKLPPQTVPDGDPVVAAQVLQEAAITEALGPNPTAAQDAANAAKKVQPRVEARKQQIKDCIDQAEAEEKEVSDMDVTDPGLDITAPGVKKEPEMPDWFAYRSDTPTPLSRRSTNPTVQAGDEALLAGDTSKALELYEQAQASMTAGNPESAQLERRILFAHAIDETDVAPPTGPFKGGADFTDSEVESVLSRESAWRGKPFDEQGTYSQMFEDGDYLVKEMEVGGSRVIDGLRMQDNAAIDADYLLRSVEAEQVITDMAQSLKLDVPAVRARILRNADGEIIKVQFIYRRLSGTSLEKLDPEVVFQYRQQVAEMFTLGNLVHDFDRHAGNYRVVDGRLVGLDWGQGDPRGSIARAANALNQPPLPGTRAEAYLTGMYGRDAWFDKAYDQVANLDIPAPGKVSAKLADAKDGLRTLTSQESLRYKDCEKMLGKIDDMMKDEAELRELLQGSYMKIRGTQSERDAFAQAIRKTMGPDVNIEEQFQASIKEMVDQTVENLKWRHKYLRSMMEGLDTREHINVKTPSNSTQSLLRPRFQQSSYRKAA